MKRIYLLIILAALLTAGCGAVDGPAEGGDMAAADIEIKAEVSAAEEEKPSDTEQPPEETAESVTDSLPDDSSKVSEESSEGEFPGGLDDDGRGPDESETGSFPGGLDDDGKGPDEDHFSKEAGFAPGIWWSHSEDGDSYYEFNTDGTGTQVWQSNGSSKEFTYRMDGGKFYKNFGTDPEMLASAEERGDGVLLTYTVYGSTEELVYMGNISFDEFLFYSNDTLGALAKEYYKQHNDTGYVPEFCDVFQSDTDTDIVIHLYDMVDGHNSTAAWYYIDRFTGKGTDIMENEVDLPAAVAGQAQG